MGLLDIFKKPFKSVNVPEALQLIEDGAIFVDVRSKAEFKLGHARMAKNVELRDAVRDIPSLAKGRTVIITCKSGARSSMACTQLQKAGFTDLVNLRGGMMAWRMAGQPLVASGGRPGDVA